MVANIIDGKTLAATIRRDIANEIATRVNSGARNPGLAVILVGRDPASVIYVKNKRLACQEVGIRSVYFPLPDHTKQEELIGLIKTLNQDETIDGILLQLPLPSHMNSSEILEEISPYKDVDGFHPYNLGRLAQGRPTLRPCTPFGIKVLLDHINEPYKNRHAVIVGASNIVGRPLALELLMAGCTITVCHRLTQNLESFVRQADILISAVGKPDLIKGDWIKEKATVIDVGINRLEDGTIKGDIEFTIASHHAAWITPVPGGVGPMTVAMLLKNTLIACYEIEKR